MKAAKAAALLVLGLFTAVAAPAVAQQGQGAPPPDVKPPTVVQHVDAVYPPSALSDRKHADVVLALTVDVDGHVSKVDVLESGGADLDEAAVVAARQWTFVAATRNGKPIPSRIRVPFHFAPPAPPPETVSTSTPGTLPEQSAVPQATVQPAVAPAPVAPPPAAAAPAVTDAAAPPPEEVEQVDVHGHLEARPHGASDYQFDARQAEGRPPRERLATPSSSRPASSSRTRAARATPSRSSCAASTRTRGRTSSSPSTASPSTTRATTTATATQTRTSSSPSSFTRCACSKGRTRPSRATSPSPAAPTTSSGSTAAASRPSTPPATSTPSACSCCGGRADAPAGTFAAAEYFTTDGFGQNRQAKRGTAIGQWETPIGKGHAAHQRHRVRHRVQQRRRGAAGRLPARPRRLLRHRGSEPDGQHRQPRLDLGDVREALQGHRHLAAALRHRPHHAPARELDGLPPRRPAAHAAAARSARRPHRLPLRRGLGRRARHGALARRLPRPPAGGRSGLLRAASIRRATPRIASPPAPTRPTCATPTTRPRSGTSACTSTATSTSSRGSACAGGVRADMFLFDVLNNCAIKSVDSPSTATAASQIDQSCLSQLEHGAYVEPVRSARPPPTGPSCRAARSSSGRSSTSSSTRAWATACARSTPATSRRGCPRRSSLRSRATSACRTRATSAAPWGSPPSPSSSRPTSTRTSSSIPRPVAIRSPRAPRVPAGRARCAPWARSSIWPRTRRS